MAAQSIGGVGFAGLTDVTIGLAGGRVCTAGFTSKCFSTPAGNKSSRRSRIACPHIDARERFNNFEICAADAVGQRPMSREISWVVQGIIGNLSSSPFKLAIIRQKHRGAPTRYARWVYSAEGRLNQCGFLAGDAHTMKIDTPLRKPAVRRCLFWQ